MWAAPRTWVTGELVTAAMMNTHVRDNLLALRGSTTVKNTASTYAGFTPIAWTSAPWDDLGIYVASQPFLVVPWSGRFKISLWSACSGQSGGGSSQVKINRLDSSGAFIEELGADDQWSLNSNMSLTAMGDFNLTERIEVQAANGATGTAGIVAIRATIEARG